jgi:hypothetical protein
LAYLCINSKLGQISFLSNEEKSKIEAILHHKGKQHCQFIETTMPNGFHLELYKSFYPIECNSRATNAAVDSIMHRKSAVSLQESTGCLDSFDTLFGSHDV